MVIDILNLTKNFGHEKGVFDLSMQIKKGEVFGFLGPNGAGKTTTIRHLMGFLSADEGTVKINNLDAFLDASQIQKNVGYIPGETVFMESMTGLEFIHFMGSLRKMKSYQKADELIKRFQLDAKVKIKKMSKGMKQKVAIVVAFMHDPAILILDEPTSGLDPLMQKEFIDLILEEKEKGKTILMSSHIFEEVEKTCERVSILKNGRMIVTDTMANLKKKHIKKYTITFSKEEEVEKFLKEKCEIVNRNHNQVTLVCKNNINEIIKILTKYDILELLEEEQHLEELFMEYYGGKSHEL